MKNSTGITFYDGLMLMLIGFKLAGIIDWPWYQVIGLPVFVLLGVGLLLTIVNGLTKLVDD